MTKTSREDNHHQSARRTRRGVTLIELLVTLSVMLVVLGITMEIFIESNRSTQRITRYQLALQYCQQVMNQAGDTIGSAIMDPSGLKGIQNADKAYRFERHDLSLICLGRGVEIFQVSLGVDAQEKKAQPDKKSEVLRRLYHPLAGGAGVLVKDRLERLGGATPEHFSPTLKFGYAGAAEPGQMPVYQDSWTSTALPVLIRITVQAKVDDDPMHPIELQTAVIPGLMPARRALMPAAAATPAAAPMAPATPGAPATPVAPAAPGAPAAQAAPAAPVAPTAIPVLVAPGKHKVPQAHGNFKARGAKG